jgi:hypothetical protein
MNFAVIDIETDGLMDDEGELKKAATKIHCMSVNQFHEGNWRMFTLTDPDKMKEFLSDVDCLVGHNIIRFDVPMLEKMLDITIHARKIDTLGLSWYLYPLRNKHGLDSWGNDLGIEKPKIADWQNQTIEEYINRCEQDVRINTEVFQLQKKYLLDIYGTWERANRIVGYLSFKLDCAREQSEVKWRIDIDVTKRNLEKLEKEKEEKYVTLSSLMPPVIQYKTCARPKVLFKKDGTPSEHGKKWFALLKENGLPEYHVGTLKIKVGEIPGNPSSQQQLKDWLFSLGWEPDNYKIVKEEDNTTRKIPQIGHADIPGELSDSVQALFEKMPELEHLEGYFVLQHRIGILSSFLENVDASGFVKSEIKGFTNTLRFKHKVPIVNLPQIPRKYWKEIRECLVYPQEGWVLCGSDMSGLEDNTKQHYMWKYDKEYVIQMRQPGWDPHLDIAVLAGLLTQEQSDEHKLYDRTKGAEGKSYKGIRLKAKKVNFAGIYGAGAQKLSLTASISLQEAKNLHTTYWKRNKAVKLVSENCVVKRVGGQMWLYNPVSGFWYSLRVEKDKFSTLNQGTGVYCFDTWVRFVRKQGIKLCCQYHDEIVFPLRVEDKDDCSQKLDNAIQWTNEELKLNVPLSISKDFGLSYAEIH